MINPKLLCNQHLLGEHGEIHKHRHVFVKGYKIEGRRGQIQPKDMGLRHDQLVAEMLRRGMNHKSPFIQPELNKYPDDYIENFVVDTNKSLYDLIDRCSDCRGRIMDIRICDGCLWDGLQEGLDDCYPCVDCINGSNWEK
jgi:hypothetical protein